MTVPQPNEPNPLHKAETSSNAITICIECDAVGPDHPEILERERQRHERMQQEKRDASDRENEAE